MEEKYIIGIDLGTTNTTVSYCLADNSGDSPDIKVLDIDQVMSNGKIGSSRYLSSCAYMLNDEEKKQLGIDETCVVGEYAKYMASKQPNKVVASAKSWLSHSGVDRREAFLPSVEIEDDTFEKISPFNVIRNILKAVCLAWNNTFPDSTIENQYVSITVPASFDPSARQLIQEAAESLNLSSNLLLLEEPQAAFYNWLYSNNNWKELLQVNDKIVVVDIGGGTADFSLIQLSDSGGCLDLERVAVGEHLLLGGDNIDLALAHKVKQSLEDEGKSLDAFQFSSLIYQCREAKEELLSPESNKESFQISIQKPGRRLIGGSIKASINKSDVESILKDGFFPIVPLDEQPYQQQFSGLKSIGLPYASDPRLTAHLAKFYASSVIDSTDENTKSTMHVLFNGGPTNSKVLRQRLIDQISQWTKSDVQEMTDVNLDVAVSSGATYYKWSTLNDGIRVKSGLSHSYFVEVEESMPAIPGLKPKKFGLCIAPKGLEEGSQLSCPSQEFSLVVGSQVNFMFYANRIDAIDEYKNAQVGSLMEVDLEQLEELPAIETQLSPKEGLSAGFVHVKINVAFTELGTLEIYFEDAQKHAWQLNFDIRASQEIGMATS